MSVVIVSFYVLNSFNQGKKHWSIKLQSDITAVGVMDHKQQGFKATVIGLADKTVCIYRDKFLINKFTTPDVVKAILFGRFGREDGSLVMVMKGMFIWPFISAVLVVSVVYILKINCYAFLAFDFDLNVYIFFCNFQQNFIF